MNKLNRKLEYALMTLQYLMENPREKVSAKEVCEKTGSPFDATARVMQIMTQHGLLRSEQGVKGGYLLVKNLSEVSFLELMEMILGPIEVAKCVGNVMGCELISKCNIQSPVQRINLKIRDFFAELQLSEVLINSNPSILVQKVQSVRI